MASPTRPRLKPRRIPATDAVRAEAAELRAQIAARDVEYNAGRPTLADDDYDVLVNRLIHLESAYPELKTPDSPTQQVRDDKVAGFAKRAHAVPMLSLENVFSADELQAWLDSTTKSLRSVISQFEAIELAIEPKIDGLAISLTYDRGRLIAATTRGDGKIGDDVTANALKVAGIPAVLAGEGHPETFECRGEVYMPRAAFERLNAELVAAGDEPFANPRNAAAGSLRLHDPAEVGRRGLAFLAHGLGHCSDDASIMDHGDALARFHGWGLAVVGYDHVPENWYWHSMPSIAVDDHDSVREAVSTFEVMRQTPAPYDTDGLVIKVNAMSQRARLGTRTKSPRWAVAYKYETEKVATKVNGITTQVGKTGKLTPVAELEPVALGGSTVARASLCNFDEIQRLDIRVGDTVVVQKAAEIIPQVVANLATGDAPRGPATPRPDKCPACGGPLLVEAGVVDVFCAAHPATACKAQLKALIKHYASREAMDIDGLGEVMIAQLVDKGYVSRLADLYRLGTNDLMELHRVGERTAIALIAAIDQTLFRPLQKFLRAIPIPQVGEGGARRLAEHFGSFAAIRAATREQLLAVKDVGADTADAILGYFADPAEVDELDDLLKYVRVKDEVVAKKGTALAGKTIVVTGTLPKYGRKEIEELIRANGGTVSGSVSKKTSFVVAGEEAGSKLQKANELGVTVLDEAGFDALLAGGA